MTDNGLKRLPYSVPEASDAERLAKAKAFAADIGRRRSVRDFSSRPVPRELIEELLRAAGSAPSGANKQPWTFVAISNADLQARLRTAAETEEKISYDRRMGEEWLADLAHIGTTWEKPHITEAPWIIVVFSQDYALDAEGKRGKHYYVRESVGLAVGFLLVAIHEAGLVALTHTPSPMKFLSEILDRPRNETAYLLIPVGFPADDCQVPDQKRKELDEFVVWHTD